MTYLYIFIMSVGIVTALYIGSWIADRIDERREKKKKGGL